MRKSSKVDPGLKTLAYAAFLLDRMEVTPNACGWRGSRPEVRASHEERRSALIGKLETVIEELYGFEGRRAIQELSIVPRSKDRCTPLASRILRQVALSVQERARAGLLAGPAMIRPILIDLVGEPSSSRPLGPEGGEILAEEASMREGLVNPLPESSSVDIMRVANLTHTTWGTFGHGRVSGGRLPAEPLQTLFPGLISLGGGNLPTGQPASEGPIDIGTPPLDVSLPCKPPLIQRCEFPRPLGEYLNSTPLGRHGTPCQRYHQGGHYPRGHLVAAIRAYVYVRRGTVSRDNQIYGAPSSVLLDGPFRRSYKHWAMGSTQFFNTSCKYKYSRCLSGDCKFTCRGRRW